MVLMYVLTVAMNTGDVDWQYDYRAAVAQTKSESKMLFVAIDFEGTAAFEWQIPAEARREFVFLRLRWDAKIEWDGMESVLLQHQAFEAMRDRPGFLIIDFKNEGPNFAHVVSVLPAEYVTSVAQVLALFDLPGGSLTQRTLIWALRIHPQSPQSTSSELHVDLVRHAQNHAQEQARRNWQHHNMPSFATSEIVAESWPWNKCIVAAAVDMVDAWSQSPGHWREASRPHKFFGYDMRSNGTKWFATGVFIE